LKQRKAKQAQLEQGKKEYEAKYGKVIQDKVSYLRL
jgi:hypothetical protein